MSNILGSSWIVKVNGVNTSGLQRHGYCRGLFDTLIKLNPSARVQIVRIDRVATDFATTGRNWNNVQTIEDDTQPELSVGEEAARAATVAAKLNDPNMAIPFATPYYEDAVYMLVETFGRAKREGRLNKVVAAFYRLAEDDGYRVHKLLISLKRGRQTDVLNALATY